MKNHNNANYEIKKTINKKIINRKNIEVPVIFLSFLARTVSSDFDYCLLYTRFSFFFFRTRS